MSIDLASLTDPTPPDFTQSIPLNVDPFPYDDLSAQGRYPVQSTPDTYPPFVGLVSGIKAENPSQGRAGYIDEQHRLLVHDPASSGGSSRPSLDLTTWESALVISTTGHFELVTCNQFPAYLYGLSAGPYFDAGQTPANGYLIVGLKPTFPGASQIALGTCGLSSSGACTALNLVYPGGFALDAPSWNHGGFLDVYFETNTPPLTVSFSLTLGST